MNKTKIPWTEFSWNPVVGCTPCSPGCANCYAKALHDKRHGCYARLTDPDSECGLPIQYAQPFSTIQCLAERLDEPLRRRTPSKIFVCSMSDLFHEDVPEDFVDRVYEVMSEAKQHTFQVLTKRPENVERKLYGVTLRHPCRELGGGDHLLNVHLGVTVCNQAEADAKIPVLLSIPAAVRWLSVEPMLEAIDLHLPPGPNYPLPHITLVVVGAESGPHRRPCNVEWVRSVVEQCKAAGVPVFVKQLDINGKCIADPAQFPDDLRLRQMPGAKSA